MPWIWVAFWVSLAITIILFIIGLLSKARDPIELVPDLKLLPSDLGQVIEFPSRAPAIALDAASSRMDSVAEQSIQSCRQLETTIY